MRRQRRSIRFLTVLAVLLVVGALAVAAEDGRATRTRPAAAEDRPRASRPGSDEAPDELRVVPPGRTADATGAGDATNTRPHDDREDPALQFALDAAVRAGADAGRSSAVETVQVFGTREYYRVGWHRGMGRALGDPELGRWDRERGFEAGRRDPDARRAGLAEGARAARFDAEVAADGAVEATFRDLNYDPVRDPRPSFGEWTAPESFVDAPELRAVVEAHPVGTVTFLEGRAADAFRGWTHDPWTLSQTASHGEFWDGTWRDPGMAFDRFVSDRRGARSWFRLRSAAERQAYRGAFDDAFARTVAAAHGRSLDRAYRDGWNDGWEYGAFVSYEWNWEQGYAEGFDRAAAFAASSAYGREYAAAFGAAYETAFVSWERRAVPGIEQVTLFDGNDDGVFEPGEIVVVEIRAVNYGGGIATVPLIVDGRRLDRSADAEIVLDGRGDAREFLPLRVAIRTDAPLRLDATVDVSFGDARVSAPLRVGRPLELEPSVGLDADVVAGRAVVEIGVANRSRRPVAGTVRLERADGVAVPAAVVEPLAPGASRTVAFRLDRIPAAALVGGSFEARVVVLSDGVVQDELPWRAPDRAADLSSRDFVRWVESLAGSGGLATGDLDDLRVLVARRLEADWREAVRGRGNPYKEDAKRGTATTAVGELVRARAGSRSDVFAVIADEIDARSDALPGTHPLLRKWLRRLAGELG